MVEHKRYLKYVEITNQSSNSLPTLLPIGLFSLSIICIAAKASWWMPQIFLSETAIVELWLDRKCPQWCLLVYAI